MLAKEFIAKLTKYEIKIRQAVHSHMRGNYHSIFKGTGIEFSDHREYQYGDDVRLIDWNASAKGHGVFVKKYKEDKEQTVFFVVDVSGSQEVGRSARLKIDTSKEIAGVLSLSAIKEASNVGLYCFSDRKEKYIKPENSMKHGYHTVMELFKLKPESKKTDIAKAIIFTLNILKKRSLVILISDFIDENYGDKLKALARKHDLIVIHVYDQTETSLPKLGIIPIYDTETQQTVWVNTSSPGFRNNMKMVYHENAHQLEQICKENNANYLSLDIAEDYVPKLVRLFKVRK
ncbi:MAG: DUF58 domain-containing protein [Pseudarcicella sp.]|nr:DUF58 domain-containing protein [Pseudarcicella sp.]